MRRIRLGVVAAVISSTFAFAPAMTISSTTALDPGIGNVPQGTQTTRLTFRATRPTRSPIPS